jgi:hypothetical protein
MQKKIGKAQEDFSSFSMHLSLKIARTRRSTPIKFEGKLQETVTEKAHKIIIMPFSCQARWMFNKYSNFFGTARSFVSQKIT